MLCSYSLLLKLYVQRTLANFLLIPSSVLQNGVRKALVLIKMNDIVYGIPHKHSFLPLLACNSYSGVLCAGLGASIRTVHACHEGEILIKFYCVKF